MKKINLFLRNITRVIGIPLLCFTILLCILFSIDRQYGESSVDSNTSLENTQEVQQSNLDNLVEVDESSNVDEFIEIEEESPEEELQEVSDMVDDLEKEANARSMHRDIATDVGISRSSLGTQYDSINEYNVIIVGGTSSGTTYKQLKIDENLFNASAIALYNDFKYTTGMTLDQAKSTLCSNFGLTLSSGYYQSSFIADSSFTSYVNTLLPNCLFTIFENMSPQTPEEIAVNIIFHSSTNMSDSFASTGTYYPIFSADFGLVLPAYEDNLCWLHYDFIGHFKRTSTLSSTDATAIPFVTVDASSSTDSANLIEVNFNECEMNDDSSGGLIAFTGGHNDTLREVNFPETPSDFSQNYIKNLTATRAGVVYNISSSVGGAEWYFGESTINMLNCTFWGGVYLSSSVNTTLYMVSSYIDGLHVAKDVASYDESYLNSIIIDAGSSIGTLYSYNCPFNLSCMSDDSMIISINWTSYETNEEFIIFYHDGNVSSNTQVNMNTLESNTTFDFILDQHYKYYKITRVSERATGYVTLSAITGSIEYGTSSKTFTISSYHGGTLSVTDNNSTASVSISGTTVTISNLSAITKGTTITVTVTCAATTTYKSATATYKLTINQATGILTLSATSGSMTYYSASSKTFTVSKNHGGTLSVTDNNSTASVSISGTTVTISNLKTISAGTTITVTVTCAATTNYKAASKTYELTITTATITLSGNTDYSKTYDGNTYTSSITATTVNSQTATIYYSKTNSMTSSSDATTYGSTTKPTFTNVSDSGTVYYYVTAANHAARYGSYKVTINQANGSVALSAPSGSVKYKTSTATFSVSSSHGGTLSVSDNNSTASVSVNSSTKVVTISNIGSLNAGTTITVTVTCAATTNYKKATATYTLTITKANGYVTLSAPTGTSPYGTATKTFTVNSYSGTPTVSETTSTNATVSINSSTKVVTIATLSGLTTGTTVTIKVSIAASDNYEATSATYTLTIVKADGKVTLAAPTGTSAYGTKTATFSVSSNHGGTLSVTDDNSTATVAVSGTTVTISGLGSLTTGTKVVVTVKCATTTNYKEATATYTLTIVKADGYVTLTTTSGNSKYGVSTATFTVSTNSGTLSASADKGTASVSGKTVTISGIGSFDAGTIITVTVTAAAATNYNSKSTTYTLTIVQTEGYVTLASTIGSVTYGTSSTSFTVSTSHGGTLSVSDNNDTASSGISSSKVTISNLSSIAAGKTITVTVTCAATTNYKKATATYTLTINKATGYITLSAPSGQSEYKVSSATFNVATFSPDGTLSVSDNNSTATVSISGTKVTISNIGALNAGTTIAVTVSVKNAPNHNDKSTTYTLTIIKTAGSVGLSGSSGSVTYGTSTKSFTVSSNLSGGSLSVSDNNSTAEVAISGTTVTISKLNTLTTGTKVVVTVTSATTTNYNAASATYTLTINKATGYITLSAYEGTSVYGTTSATFTVKTYSGALSATSNKGTASISGTTVTISGIGSVDADTTVTVTVTAAAATNYNAKSTTYTLTIEKADIRHSATGVSKVYDGLISRGSVSVTTVNNETATILYSYGDSYKNNLTNPGFINVNSFTVTYTITADNHNPASGSFNVSITKASLSVIISCSDQTSTYNKAVSYTGNYYIKSHGTLLGQDSSSNISSIVTITGTPVYTFNNTTLNQNVGTYQIKASGLTISARNYSITTTYDNVGKLIINPKQISKDNTSVTFLNLGTLYYNPNVYHEPTPTVKIKLIDGGSYTTLTQGTDYTVEYFDNHDAGYAYIKVTGIGNYGNTETFENAFEILPSDIPTENLPQLPSLVSLTVLTLENNIYRLSKVSDIELTAISNGYGYWAYGVDTSNIIYTTNGQYEYQIAMIFNSTDSNYNNSTGTLYVSLDKNDVEVNSLGTITKTYDRGSIDTPSNPIKNYNTSYHSVPTFTYYFNEQVTTTPATAGSYSYGVSIAANQYFNSYVTAKASRGNIIINKKNISDADIIYPTIADQVYTGSAITPSITITYNSIALTTDEISISYDNHINSKVVSGDYAVINITAKDSSNYIGSNSVKFTILQKEITESSISIADIENIKYDGTAKEPKPVVKDVARNVSLQENSDFTFGYANNTNVGQATITVIANEESSNYKSSTPGSFTIIKGDLPSSRYTVPFGLVSTVDSKLSSIDMSEFNIDGTWYFYNKNTQQNIDLSTIVSEQKGYVTYNLRFIPTNINYNDVLTESTTITVELNGSKVEFVGDVSKIYDTYDMNLSIDDIVRKNTNDEEYESEFDNDTVVFTYYDLNGDEVDPINVGTYKVVVLVFANRKYESATAEQEFTISPADINNAQAEILNPDSGENKYQYTTKEIEPLFKLSYNNDSDLSSYIDNVSFDNNIEISTDSSKAIITVIGKGNYTDSKEIEFIIIQRDLATLSIIDIQEQYYTGDEIEPQITIFNHGTPLEKDIDFEVSYDNNIEVGTATVTVTGKGKYNGNNGTTFEIVLRFIDPSKLPEFSNLVEYVNTPLSEISLPSNNYGSWYFKDLDTDADKTVGLANAEGIRLAIEFRDKENAYAPTESTITIVVVKYTATIVITSTLDMVYDTLAVANPEYTCNYTNGDEVINYEGNITINFYQGTNLISNPVNAGSYSVEIIAEETDMFNSASIKKSFKISKARIGLDETADAIITPIPEQAYQNDAQITPVVEIIRKDRNGDSHTLNIDSDFFVIYGPNYEAGIGTGYVNVVGMNNYYTETYEEVLFDIGDGSSVPAPDPIKYTIELEYEEAVYNTKEHTPSVTVYKIVGDNDPEVVDSDTYSINYVNNIYVGTATVEVISDNFETLTGTFIINQYQITDKDVKAVYDSNDDVKVYVFVNDVLVHSVDEETGEEHYSYTISGSNVIVTGKDNCYGTGTSEIQYNILKLKDDSKFGFYTHNGRKWNAVTHETYTGSTDIYLICVTEFVENIDINTFLNEQFINSSDYIRIKDIEGNLITEYDRCIGTGCVIELVVNEEILDSITVIIIGDLDGNGKLTMNDAIEYAGVSNKEEDNKILYYASDANHSGKVNSDDLLLLIELW